MKWLVSQRVACESVACCRSGTLLSKPPCSSEAVVSPELQEHDFDPARGSRNEHRAVEIEVKVDDRVDTMG